MVDVKTKEDIYLKLGLHLVNKPPEIPSASTEKKDQFLSQDEKSFDTFSLGHDIS
jgi:hypothetical protein